MKRFTSAIMVGALVVLVAASPARAQYVFFGGGLSKPVGDFNTYAKTGWMATAGVGYDIGSKGLWVEAEGYFGSNKHSDFAGDKTNLIGGMAAVGYSFMPGKSVSPYITGGLGIVAHQFKSEDFPGGNETESKLGYTGAFGVGFNGNKKVHPFVEGRLLGSESSKALLFLAGVSIQLSSK
jgi:opacity protein-like surface antigen